MSCHVHSLVQEYGTSAWSQIGRRFGRNGKQCRERWNNHLAPDIKSSQWTADEEHLFIKLHQELGNKWADIAKNIPGRTENNVKNHWNATRRRRDILKTKYSLTRPDVLRNYILMLVNCDKLSEQRIAKTTSANEKREKAKPDSKKRDAVSESVNPPQLPAMKRVKAAHDGEKARFRSRTTSSDNLRSVTDTKAPHNGDLFSEAYEEVFGNDTDFDESGGGVYSESDNLDMDFVTSLLGPAGDHDVCAELDPASSLQNDDSAATTTKSIAAKAGHEDVVESDNDSASFLTIDWPYVIGASCPWNDEFMPSPRTNWVDEPATPAPMTETPFTMDIADDLMDAPHGVENVDASHRDIISAGRDIDIMQFFILSIDSTRAKTGSYIGRLDGYPEIKEAAASAETASTTTVTEKALREIVARVRNSCAHPIQCSVSLRLTALDEIVNDKKHSPQLAIYVSSTCDATDVKDVAYRIVVGIVRQFVSAHN